MNRFLRLGALLAVLLSVSNIPASLAGTVRIVTSLSDLADLAQQIGGEKVRVDYIVKGDRNPHFVEVKPSYMMKLKSADLFFLVGMDLEMWAPQIIDGSRNSRLQVVELSGAIRKREVPVKTDASQGDVHRFGNPHYWLDPRNIRPMMETMVKAMALASPEDGEYFRENADRFLARLDQKIAGWEGMMKPHAGKKIITFHSSWSYFAGWLGLTVAGQVEPFPGIAPSPGHTAEIMRIVRQANIKVMVVEPFYDSSAADQIARATGAKVIRLATSVGGVASAADYVSLMDYNISSLVEALP